MQLIPPKLAVEYYKKDMTELIKEIPSDKNKTSLTTAINTAAQNLNTKITKFSECDTKRKLTENLITYTFQLQTKRDDKERAKAYASYNITTAEASLYIFLDLNNDLNNLDSAKKLIQDNLNTDKKSFTNKDPDIINKITSRLNSITAAPSTACP